MNLKSCRVLVTPTSFGKTDPRLCQELEAQVGEVVYNPVGRALTSDEVRHLLPGVDGYIAGVDAIDRAALEAADRLKVIARYGVGVDGVDREALRERGIRLTNTPGANATSVAELTIGLMISLARAIPFACSQTRAGGWPRLNGVVLEGKTAGLLGVGAIGKQVAVRLRGLEMRLLAYDLCPDRAFMQANSIELRGQDEVVREADFLSLHLPVTPETHGLVNAAFLEAMKPGAFLINTARGDLLDETAVAEALRSGHLGGLGLDVFNQEPPELGESPAVFPAGCGDAPHRSPHRWRDKCDGVGGAAGLPGSAAGRSTGTSARLIASRGELWIKVRSYPRSRTWEWWRCCADPPRTLRFGWSMRWSKGG